MYLPLSGYGRKLSHYFIIKAFTQLKLAFEFHDTDTILSSCKGKGCLLFCYCKVRANQKHVIFLKSDEYIKVCQN